MVKYKSSKTIENEAKRLSLLAVIANNDSKKVLSLIKNKYPKIKKILDVGCGAGEAFRVFADVFPRSQIIGVDLNKQSLQVAAKRSRAEKLITADITNLPGNQEIQKETPFDLVFVRNTLMHVSDPEQVLIEMGKCTRPGGIVFAQETNWQVAEANFEEFDIFKKSLIAMMQVNHINPYMGRTLKEIFKKLGYKNIQQSVFTTTIESSDKTWDILESLLEVAGARIEPFLKKYGVSSAEQMKERLRQAKRKTQNSFHTPAWVIVYGEV